MESPGLPTADQHDTLKMEEHQHKLAMGTFIGFTSATAEAVRLYRGCADTQLNKSLRTAAIYGLPDFVIIGVQKGGTTTIMRYLSEAACVSSAGEPHLFDAVKLEKAQVSAYDLSEYSKNWRKCKDKSKLLFEKSPAYIYQHEWAPVRYCETMPEERQKVVVFLRDPVARAYSSFYQGKSLLGERNRDSFHRLSEIDIAVAKRCLTASVPDNDFRQCCHEAVAPFGYYRSSNGSTWPGCECKEGRSRRLQYQCTRFGDKRVAQVRIGMYARQLRSWLMYVHADDLLVFKSEEAFLDMGTVRHEILSWVRQGQRQARPYGARQQHPIITNGSTVPRLNHKIGTEVPMREETLELLRNFYSPLNAELEALLGRSMNWGY